MVYRWKTCGSTFRSVLNADDVTNGVRWHRHRCQVLHHDLQHQSASLHHCNRDKYNTLFQWGHIDKRLSHHSAERGKYYTNRLYMKKCAVCSSWNNLAVMQCTHCLAGLGDDSIRLRTVDPLCRTANSRKNDAEAGMVDYIALYRCFDFAIILHPQPAAPIHLTAVPNGTFYDIKNFRKNHVSMLNKMKLRCDSILRDIISGTLVPDFLKNEHVARLQEEARKESGKVSGTTVTDMVSHTIYGFNYPSSFSHVEMHAVLPPVRSFNIFKSPFFYPLSKILSDLEHLSQVKSYTPDEARQLYEQDIILDDIMDIDRTFRKTYNF
ncbi:hypothetical protein X943_002755 [Babesia divergens]|uniref:Uncharacterized protein n=1 Tax=Babesia divergens TaxID=32595 RepID=A0AAD9LE85_BABDI|nr:hypothetical protein X943_002755 [Babesia divergens]